MPARLTRLLAERFDPDRTAELRAFIYEFDTVFRGKLTGDPIALHQLASEAAQQIVQNGMADALIREVARRWRAADMVSVARRSSYPEFGKATVYLDYYDTVPIAIKVWQVSENGGAELGERVKVAAEQLRALDHKNIVQIYKHVSDEKVVCLVMENLVACEALVNLHKSGLPQDLLDVYIAAGEGLAAMHSRGISHRNFKPDNVLIRGGPEALSERVRIIGFGLEGVELGGNPYFSGTPEWCEGKSLSDKSDQFAFCVGLFHALFKSHPYFDPLKSTQAKTFPWNYPETRHAAKGEDGGKGGKPFVDAIRESLKSKPLRTPSSVPAGCEGVLQVLCKGLERTPGKRFSSMNELLDALKAERAKAVSRAEASQVVHEPGQSTSRPLVAGSDADGSLHIAPPPPKRPGGVGPLAVFACAIFAGGIGTYLGTLFGAQMAAPQGRDDQPKTDVAQRVQVLVKSDRCDEAKELLKVLESSGESGVGEAKKAVDECKSVSPKKGAH